ncbi:hypothetical protein [Psychrobacter sp. ANT_WB68]|uniref:hypothetical protein n=1 Tax=Psychrobacter sp. ANT_WB68 TaxID=2597355 RepID=UPI0011F33C22|nr:hypothetical protein [Psychrobacter sp. ANT_WB68]KAA0914325.1 hypothetical protein FQ084_07075 [Psychrobacter sp. ANT_WB68]
MDNKSLNNNDIDAGSLDHPKNNTVTSVEVVKNDEAISEEHITDKSDKEDKYSSAIGNIYQWASKLKDEFKSEASDMTHEVSEKAAAMILSRLLEGIDTELEAFDKQVEASKELLANAEAERKKIADKKNKYQDMIDQLES